MAIDLLYFAAIREAIGMAGERIDPPVDAHSAGALADWLAARGGGYAVLADRARLRVAIDQHFAAFDAPIADAREIAFFPPVTGG